MVTACVILRLTRGYQRVRVEASILVEHDIAVETCMVGYTRWPQAHNAVDMCVSYWSHGGFPDLRDLIDLGAHDEYDT